MNCIVIDDEPLAREKIRMLVEKDVTLQLLGCFDSPIKAVGFLELNQVDLIFLDIRMHGMSGLDFARTYQGEALVIFTSAHAAYALESYDVRAIDFLVKPIHPLRFVQAVQKALEYVDLKRQYKRQANEKQDYFFVRADRRLHRISFQECLYVEGIRDYCVLHLIDRKIMPALNLKTIQEYLPSDMFLRISKSVIVNIRHVKSLTHHDVQVGEMELGIGNAYREQVFANFVTNNLVGR
ncbi:MAG: response regulator transcription factor [Chitinophaga sp.]|uniref:LytR/AlgR family response regulator transcription factor n=1 Tax=Chitinophaga sp. TaxID=1869181 RepID=UPI0025BC05CC|nr:LytTR family DNA-binding domain-containing protein [Chitinophaga sp.]MBV8253987.1 response regulator transcription factor [Chitinophaga sp.]